MQADDLKRFTAWFSDYVSGFYTNDATYDKAPALKEFHTERVVENSVLIADSLGLCQDDRRVAQAAALFHDVGRFPQYARYHTFNDARSVNHARLSLQVLSQHRVMDSLGAREAGIIATAVGFHNALRLPGKINDNTRMTFLKLLRDADKLDIWRVVTDYYDERETNPDTVMEMGFASGNNWSAPVLSALREKTCVRLETVKTYTDFMLLHASWAFDLNTPRAYSLLKARGYLSRIREKLPRHPEIDAAMKGVFDYVETKAARR